jgi:cytoplasmic tRNA 2-thiolation protein 2
VRAWKARTAIRRGPGAPAEETEAEGRALAPHLCYACHTALTSRSARGGAQPPVEAIPLPVWAAASLALRSRDLELDGALADGLPLEDKEEMNNVGEEVWGRREVGRAEMKEQIGEFLLDE